MKESLNTPGPRLEATAAAGCDLVRRHHHTATEISRQESLLLAACAASEHQSSR
jgi:hypothetical protein